MNLQVQPLKILATREVVTKRMDYSTFLNGTTKEELDRLDMLAGDFKIQASKVTIEAVCDGKKLPDDWDHLKSALSFKLPTNLISFIERTQGFSIVESKNLQRDWAMYGIGLWWRQKMLENRSKLNFSSHTGRDRWNLSESFIEDGKIVNTSKIYKMVNSKIILTLDVRESITTDKEGNIIWKFMWSAPHRGVKITKVVRAVRVHEAGA